MPELPEVEIIRIGIEKNLPKTSIKEVLLLRKDLRFLLPSKELLNLKNKTLISIGRRGKFLILKSENEEFISHLGMTGHWRYEKVHKPTKHDHIIIQWEDTNLIYNDPRRFGYILKNDSSTFKNFGPDPILDSINSNDFFIKGKKAKTPIKNWLLNQKNILGIGNIYASEILFKSKINPKKLASKLKLNQWEDIIKHTLSTLKEAIQKGGSSLRDYKNVEGKQGDMQNHWMVYGKENQPCSICKTKIKKIVQTNRSTYFCPNCQK